MKKCSKMPGKLHNYPIIFLSFFLSIVLFVSTPINYNPSNVSTMLYFPASLETKYACSFGRIWHQLYNICIYNIYVSDTVDYIWDSRFERKKQRFVSTLSLMETHMSWKSTCWRPTVTCWIPHLLLTAQSGPKHWRWDCMPLIHRNSHT